MSQRVAAKRAERRNRPRTEIAADIQRAGKQNVRDYQGQQIDEAVRTLERRRAERDTPEPEVATPTVEHPEAGHDDADDMPLPDEPTDEYQSGPRFIATRASEVTTRRVDWWEPKLIPRDMLTFVAGREGVGKSTVVTNWAARETRAGGTVLWIASPEEPRSHIIVPRLRASDADLDRVLFLDTATEHDPGLTMPRGESDLRQFISDHAVTLVVIDPAKSLLGSQDRDTDRDVRAMLESLAMIAEATRCVILGIAHFGKRDSTDSGHLMVGSIAWSQVPRSVLSVAPDEDDGTLIITNTKSNLAERRSLAARIIRRTIDTDDGETTTGVLEWLGDTRRDARDLLSRSPGGNSELDDWLAELLADGPALSRDLYAAGEPEGYSESQIKRAVKRIGARRWRTAEGWFTELEVTEQDSTQEPEEGDGT